MQQSLGVANGVAAMALGELRGLRSLGRDRALLPSFAAAVATGRARAEAVARSQAALDAAVQVCRNRRFTG